MNFERAISLIAVLFAAPAVADIIEDTNSTSYGLVIRISGDVVELGENCSEKVTRRLNLGSVQSIAFNDQCKKPAYEMTSSGATADLGCAKTKLVRVIFESSPEVVATSVSLDRKSKLIVVSTVNSGTLKGPSSNVAMLRWDNFCTRDLAAMKAAVPPGFSTQSTK